MCSRMISKMSHAIVDLYPDIDIYHVGVVIRLSAWHALGGGFASQSGHTEIHHKNGKTCLLFAMQALG